MSSAPLNTGISGRGYSSTQYVLDGYLCGQCGNKRNGDWTLPCPHCAKLSTRVDVSICTTCGSTKDCVHSAIREQAPVSNKRQKVSHSTVPDLPTRRWNRMTPMDRASLTKKGFQIRNCVTCQNGFIAKIGVPKTMCSICIAFSSTIDRKCTVCGVNGVIAGKCRDCAVGTFSQLDD